LNTDLSRVHHPVAHHLMHSLQELWRKRRGTTPYALLVEAVERLRIIPSIARSRALSVTTIKRHQFTTTAFTVSTT
jgi:hypothetical protein